MSGSHTIFAQASGSGVAGVAVIRISGDGAGAALRTLTGRDLPEPRHASMRALIRPGTGDILDDALVLWFPAPASFTGEDVAELHIHGGRATVAAVLGALTDLAGLRLAEAGEFTRRAFEGGKLDLTQVEGLADLVAAETEAQRRQARAQAEGALGRLYDGWRERLTKALAYLEAELDFSDEEVPAQIGTHVIGEVQTLREAISAHLADGHRAERLRDGIRLAIVGPPNAGKSSLMNALAKRDAAIVSEHAGTTRDVVEVHLDLGGFPLLVADTAGLREAGDAIEAEGVRRAKAWAEAADLKLAVFDGATLPDWDLETAGLLDDSTIVLVNKADAVTHPIPTVIAGHPVVALSVATGEGFETLISRLTQEVAERCRGAAEGPAPTRERHRAALKDCEASLARVGPRAEDGELELAAEDLRLAVRALGRITGRVDVEDLLDIIFRDFCIGK